MERTRPRVLHKALAAHKHCINTLRATKHPKESDLVHASSSYLNSLIQASSLFPTFLSQIPIPACFGIWLHQTQAKEKAITAEIEQNIAPSLRSQQKYQINEGSNSLGS